jgi:predicted nucleic acid-binding protein
MVSAVTERIGQENIVISDVTRIEIFFGAKNKREWLTFYKDLKIVTSLPIRPDISELAVKLVMQYCLSHKLELPDALIAATAILHQIELYTLNVKDFSFIPHLQLFRP